MLRVGVVPLTCWSSPQTHSFHPCWPRGYSSQVLLGDVYQSPCTASQRPQTFNSSARVSLSGTSNPALCRGLVSGLFDFSSCPFSRCSFNGTFQPPVTGNFIVSPCRWEWGDRRPEAPGAWPQCDCAPLQAFSAFYYTVDFLRTVMGLPVATLQQLEVATVTICNQTWAEVSETCFPPPVGFTPPWSFTCSTCSVCRELPWSLIVPTVARNGHCCSGEYGFHWFPGGLTLQPKSGRQRPCGSRPERRMTGTV